MTLILLFLFLGTKEKKIIPGKIQLISEMLYNFVAKMISDTAGSKAKPYFPFIFSLFMFVLLCNMVGMLPYSFTVTSHIIVTLIMALFVFIAVTIIGFFKHGFKYLSIFEISVFMAVITTFGALSQWPYGYLSDKLDRRVILVGTTLAAAFLSLLIIGFSYLSFTLFLFFVGIYSCASVPMYSLAVAHINDYLRSDEIIAATSTFSILVGVGAIIGPIIVSSIMTVIGSNGFFMYLFIIHGLLGLFGIYRMAKRPKPSNLESQYVPLSRNITPAGMELTPVIEELEEK